jgi:hypothetical protein
MGFVPNEGIPGTGKTATISILETIASKRMNAIYSAHNAQQI